MLVVCKCANDLKDLEKVLKKVNYMIQILAILIQRPQNINIWFPIGTKGKRTERGITEFISKPLLQHQLKRERIDFESIKARDNKNNKTRLIWSFN